MTETVYTYCQICEQACGLKVTTDQNRVIDIAPDKDNPHSWRDFCIKGAAAGDIVEHPRRILTPMQRVGDHYEERTYDEAIADISSRFNALIAADSPAAIASYAGNPNGMDFGGSLFLSMLMGAIGSHNRYWVSSIDQNALHYVAESMYGHAFATMQLDLDHCEYVLLLGGNPAISGMCWIGVVADGWKRLLARQKQGLTTVVVVDPRKTESAAKAALHLATEPEQDWALLLGMIKVIFEGELHNVADCAAADGIDELRSIAQSTTLAELATRCDVSVEQINQLAVAFASANGAAAIARTGTAIGINGSLTEWLSHALNLITGNTDRKGGRFYNPGLVDPLVAGESIFPPNPTPSRVRGLPTVAGFHALAELPGEIETSGAGQIKGLIISGGNPVISGPDGQSLDKALAKLDCLVVVDLVQRESHRHADWLIPAVHWLEREEFNPLLSGLSDSAYVQMGKRAVQQPKTVRHEWEFLRDLALAMDVPLMNQRGVNSVARLSRVLARLTGKPYHGFGPEWVARMLVAKSGKAKWRDIKRSTRGLSYGNREMGVLRATQSVMSQRIQAAPPPLLNYLRQRLSARSARSAAFPLHLLSRRRKHTMNSWYAEITAHKMHDSSGDWVEVHTTTAAELGIVDGASVRVVSATAELIARARLSTSIKTNVVVMEQGWGSRVFDPASGHGQAIGVNRNLLVANNELDPLSSVPRLNGTPVRVEPL